MYSWYWAHMLQLLKPAGPRACALQQEKQAQREAHTSQLEKKTHTAMKTQHSQKQINK